MSSTRQADEFRFVDYRINSDQSSIDFNYSTDDFDGNKIAFSETLDLNGLIIPAGLRQDTELHSILQSLHIALGLNYYKPFIPKKIVTPYKLDNRAVEFWQSVYRNGLGEFCYLNNIDPGLIGDFNASTISDSSQTIMPNTGTADMHVRVVTGIGGGKDSLVAVEVLKEMPSIIQAGFICESVSTNNLPRRKVADKTRLATTIFTRVPDQKLDEIRGSGNAYRGHTPASVIIAWAGILCCKLSNARYFIVANENSSNEANVRWKGRDINHQWTKTLEFERLLNSRLERQGIYIGYFSIVRPFNELLISKLFAEKGVEYFSTFFSCNQGSSKKTGLWCGKCAKCASSTLLLSPFMSVGKLTSIVGRNMLNDPNLTSMFTDLLGLGEVKPFDCVCTYNEALVIVKLLSAKDGYKDLPVVKALANSIDLEGIDWGEKLDKVYKINASAIPEPFHAKVHALSHNLVSQRIF